MNAIMNALVDYESSSSDSENQDEETKPKPLDQQQPASKLPKPSLDTNSLQTSVFNNPFVEAEIAKAAILEKHVKMVSGKDNTLMINGKKICWSHRKGRCRFGHNCKYAHDTDIQKTEEELQAEKQKLNTVVCENIGTMSCGPPPHFDLDPISSTDDAVWEGGNERRKRRPGLSKGLVPNKKVLKMYYDLKSKDDC